MFRTIGFLATVAPSFLFDSHASLYNEDRFQLKEFRIFNIFCHGNKIPSTMPLPHFVIALLDSLVLENMWRDKSQR